MNRPGLTVIALACTLLTGCLEVEQHPPWRQGQYNGKDDDLPQQRFYHGDRLAWMGAVINRNWKQDEYARTPDKGAAYDTDHH